MRTAYINALSHLAMQDKNVIAMISDNGAIVYDDYRARFPKQYINSGIAESSMIAMAAGLASRGKIPFAYTIGAFLAYRALEFIRNDVCMQNQNVKIVGTGAGFAYPALGPTHHVTEDIPMLRALPNLLLLSPASPREVKKCVYAAYEHEGPTYIRLGTNREPEVYDSEEYGFTLGKGVVMREGKDITLVSTGSIVYDVMEAAKRLDKEGISTRVVNVHTLKPFDIEIIKSSVEQTRAVLTVEEHTVYGGLGSIVAESLAELGTPIAFKRMGLFDFAKGYGNHDEVKEQNGISIDSICVTVRELLENVEGE